MGVYYGEGIGIEENTHQAAKWYLKSAEQGHSTAQLNLGKCYLEGKGIEKNENTALKWLKKSCRTRRIGCFFHYWLYV